MSGGRRAAALVGIALLAAGLAAASAGGFWIDEVFSAANARAGPSTFAERARGEPHSPWPVYYLLLHGWQRLWPSVAGMKTLSVLLHVGATLALVAVGRGLHGERAGWIAGVLAAANPLLAWYGGEIRMYALMLLLLVGAIGAAARAARRRTVASGAIFGAIASTVVFAHVFAAFPVLVLTGFVVLRGGRRVALGALVVGAAAAVPAVLLAAEQARHWLAWKGDVAGADYLASPLGMVAAVQAFFTAYALPLGGVSPARVIALAAIAVAGGVPLLAAFRSGVDRRWLLAALVVVGVAAPWVVQMRTRMYAPRFALVALPPLLLLLAAGLARMPRRRAVALGTVLVVGGVLAVAGRAGRTDWREVAELLRRERTRDSRLVFEGGNVVALREWFGDVFREADTLEFDGERELWSVRTTEPEARPAPAPYVRTVTRCGPERRLVEDEAPWIVRWRIP